MTANDSMEDALIRKNYDQRLAIPSNVPIYIWSVSMLCQSRSFLEA